MKRIKLLALALVPALFIASTAVAQDEQHKRQPSPKGAKVYIVTPKDGKTVKKKFKVVFGLQGMGICPAGITAGGIPIPDTGHHHLLVDVDKMPDFSKPLSAEIPDKIKHFGKGQTEAIIELAPGKHTLQLILGDYAHVPHNKPVVSKKITITVK
ncbi:MAG: hypothetical protein ACI9VS_003071 [Candidatus Binatia bacterium]|jgi:hypothetical protein